MNARELVDAFNAEAWVVAAAIKRVEALCAHHKTQQSTDALNALRTAFEQLSTAADQVDIATENAGG